MPTESLRVNVDDLSNFIKLLCSFSYKFNTFAEHFWREFSGLMPSDAIPGGADESGEITYIARFSVPAEYRPNLSRIHTLVGTLRKGRNYAEAPYQGRTVYGNVTSNLMVMCGQYSGRYKWYSPKFLFPPNCRLVIGGNEDEIPLYIGKAVEGNEKLIGKLFSDTSVHTSKLISPYKGGEITHETFDLLTYC
ncbi:hypothetical protein FQA39_LY03034 [Lamprigera yunnana]|nr:hypothetical protein FQA39_LY03034 [Lamprigera yunnana]